MISFVDLSKTIMTVIVGHKWLPDQILHFIKGQDANHWEVRLFHFLPGHGSHVFFLPFPGSVRQSHNADLCEDIDR